MTGQSSPETVEPTAEQVRSACLSYRHDFGLMSVSEAAIMKSQAREWLRAWQKEGFCHAPTPDLQEAIADRLVDWTYLHATEGVQWPSTKTKSMLIARAMQGSPTQDHADGMKAVSHSSTLGNSK